MSDLKAVDLTTPGEGPWVHKLVEHHTSEGRVCFGWRVEIPNAVFGKWPVVATLGAYGLATEQEAIAVCAALNAVSRAAAVEFGGVKPPQ
jgi:hypothetical protein